MQKYWGRDALAEKKAQQQKAEADAWQRLYFEMKGKKQKAEAELAEANVQLHNTIGASKKLAKELVDCEAERDRLREALEKIKRGIQNGWPGDAMTIRIVDNALAGTHTE
jgi:hypothetical protein